MKTKLDHDNAAVLWALVLLALGAAGLIASLIVLANILSAVL